MIVSPEDRCTFDRLFAEGSRALLTGTHQVESAAADGRPRWGIGMVLPYDLAAAHAIERTAVQAAAAAGGSCWLAPPAART